MPALRERGEDIPLLAQHFLDKHAAIQDKRLDFSPEAVRWLSTQPYPGNVRELENVVERAVTLAPGTSITRADLPAGGDEQQHPPGIPLPTNGFSLDRYLADMEQRILLKALDQTGGIRTKAADIVGMSFRSFRYRLAKYGLGESQDELGGES